jgi:hypothetical protein
MTPSAAQLEEKIAALEELRASGLASSSSDGASDTYRTKEELDAEISRLRSELSALRGRPRRHPYARPSY